MSLPITNSEIDNVVKAIEQGAKRLCELQAEVPVTNDRTIFQHEARIERILQRARKLGKISFYQGCWHIEPSTIS